MSAISNLSTAIRLSPQQRLRWRQQQAAPSISFTINSTLSPQACAQLLTQRIQRCIYQHQALRLRWQSAAGFQVPVQQELAAAQVPCEIRYRANTDSGETRDCTHTSDHGATSHRITGQLYPLSQNCYHCTLQLPPFSADRGTLYRLLQAIQNPKPEAHNPAINAEDEMSYSQYLSWLYELQNEPDAVQAHQYWQQQTQCDQAISQLVYHRTAENLTTTQSTIYADIDADLSHALQQYCAAHHCSIEATLMTAWCALLQGLQATPDAPLIVHWLHDCRHDYEELSSCWGLFTKALPLRWRCATEQSFEAALQHLQQLQDEASEWQEYYAIEQDPEPGLSRYGFEWSPRPATSTSAAGEMKISIDAITSPIQTLTLNLIVESQDHTHRLQLDYDNTSYTQQSATVLLEQYRSLLADALKDSAKPLHQLSFHSTTVKQLSAKLEYCPADPAGTTLELFPTRFSQLTAHYLQADALIDATDHASAHLRQRHWSYQDLEIRSNQLAHQLIAKGIGRESPVALYLGRSAEMVIAMLAVMKAGGCFVPLEPEQPAARIDQILNAASPQLLISRPEHRPPSGYAPLLMIDDDELSYYPNTPPEVTLHPGMIAYILFTSGSSGAPKGVAVAHRQLQNYCTGILTRIPLAAGEKSAIVTSLAADLSYTLLFPGLLSGGQIHLLDRTIVMNPNAWSDYQQKHAIEHIKTVPSLLEIWFNHPQPATILPTKQLLLGGEFCKPELLKMIRQHAPQLSLYNHYGPTETTVGVMIHRDHDTQQQRLPLSQCLDHTGVYLVDDAHQMTAPGRHGQLLIAGQCLARGYLNPRTTAERFIPNFITNDGSRLYRSGDLARYREDGSLEIVGRIDRQIKIRGYRIELDEIETILSQLPGVHQAAVLCHQHPQRGPQLHAFISLHDGHDINVATLNAQLQQQLPEPMVPQLRLMDRLPLLTNGKIDRQDLQQQAARWTHSGTGTAPRNAFEAVLTQLWAEVLGLEKVAIDDDFFELGGHSLAAVKLASRLQVLLDSPITVNAVFNAPTVAGFVALIQRELKLAPLVNLSALAGHHHTEQASTKPPQLFCFHPSTGHTQDYRSIAGQLCDWQVWGLQAADPTAENKTQGSIDQLARHYVNTIRQQQACGPYHLLGWSLGGLLAIRAAAALEQAGESVAFLGIVDSQLSNDKTPDNIDTLLEQGLALLDPESRQRAASLSEASRAALRQSLQQCTTDQTVSVLLNWAQHQGFQLQEETQRQLQIQRDQDRYTRQLIESFTHPKLNIAPHIWWADETLATATNAALPTLWEQLNPKPYPANIISATHLDILQQAEWQQQLINILQPLAAAPNKARNTTHEVA